MPITRTVMIDDDGSGTTGTIINNAWKQEFYNQIDGLAGGTWQDVPFNASDYSAVAPMTWTVGASSVIRDRYARVGNILFWSMYLSWFNGTSVLTGAPSAGLRIKLPGNMTGGGQQIVLIDYSAGVNGNPTFAGLSGAPVGTILEIAKVANANYALTDTPGIVFLITLEV